MLAASGPLETLGVLQIAVDGGVTPPLVWVANGAGWGSLVQLAEMIFGKAVWTENGDTLSCPLVRKPAARPSSISIRKPATSTSRTIPTTA